MSLMENPFPHQKKKKSKQNIDTSMISKVPLSTFSIAISADVIESEENTTDGAEALISKTETKAKKIIHETYCSMLK